MSGLVWLLVLHIFGYLIPYFLYYFAPLIRLRFKWSLHDLAFLNKIVCALEITIAEYYVTYVFVDRLTAELKEES